MFESAVPGAFPVLFYGGGCVKSAPGYALMVLIAGSCFGLISPLLKISYDFGFTTAEATDVQYVLGLIPLWLMMPFWRQGKKRITRRQWPILAVIGLASAGTSYTYYSALLYLPASLAIVLLFQFTWMVMVIDIVVTRRLPTRSKWIGAGLIVIGTILAVGLLEERFVHFPLWTIGFGLLAGFCYAVTLYLSAYVHTDTSPILKSAVIVTIATVVVFIPFPPTFMQHIGTVKNFWLWGFLMALFSQIVPPILMMIAIPHTGGRMAGVLGSIELPVAVLSAWIILGEQVNVIRWIGVVLILVGIIISEWPKQGESDLLRGNPEGI
jgi:drug/metabolite transporter (DMT)-like permease